MVDNYSDTRQDPNNKKLWWIKCSICGKDFPFKLQGSEDIFKMVPVEQQAEQARQNTKSSTDTKLLTGIKSHYARCENEKEDGSPCKTVYTIDYNHDNDSILHAYKSGNSDYDTFWIDMGRDLIKGNLENLDKRAEYMITTITALIVIDFGILVGFQVPALTLKVAPQILFAISIMLFFWSLRIKKYTIFPDSIEDIRQEHKTIGNHKYKWQNAGYYWFVAGLIAMAITYLIDSPLNYLPETFDTSKIIVDGNLKLETAP